MTENHRDNDLLVTAEVVVENRDFPCWKLHLDFCSCTGTKMLPESPPSMADAALFR